MSCDFISLFSLAVWGYNWPKKRQLIFNNYKNSNDSSLSPDGRENPFLKGFFNPFKKDCNKQQEQDC
jgi:hypothetical protein